MEAILIGCLPGCHIASPSTLPHPHIILQPDICSTGALQKYRIRITQGLLPACHVTIRQGKPTHAQCVTCQMVIHQRCLGRHLLSSVCALKKCQREGVLQKTAQCMLTGGMCYEQDQETWQEAMYDEQVPIHGCTQGYCYPAHICTTS